jgi:glycosyltransferase involved in cell wall biosynthesis/peptidoglycan/xylan/chitin deacetylase (PgdA/CDA1 family)
MMPRISVVVPCFNDGRFLVEAVDSARGQTVQDVEIIVVDDGSTDAPTQAVLADLDGKKGCVLRAPHVGPGAARNRGLREARGAFVCFLDADDVILPGWLEAGLHAFAQDPDLGYVSCWCEAFGNEQWRAEPVACDLAQLLQSNTLHCSTLVRRDVLQAVGGFDENLGAQFEDWDLWLRIASRWRGTIVPEILFRYRRRPDSATRYLPAATFGQDAYSRILAKHAALYRRWLPDLLLRQEAELTRLRREVKENLAACAGWLGDAVSGVVAPTRDGLPTPRTLAAFREIVHVHRTAFEAHQARILWAREKTLRALRARQRQTAEARAVLAAQVQAAGLGGTLHLTAGARPGSSGPYIDEFLDGHGTDRRGAILELVDGPFSRWSRVGAAERRQLAQAAALPDASYDCIVLDLSRATDDAGSALDHCHRLLRPGGLLLALLAAETLPAPGATPDSSAKRAIKRAGFPVDASQLSAYGSAVARAAWLRGVDADQLRPDELWKDDPARASLWAVRTRKAGTAGRPRRERQGAAILRYHRVANVAHDRFGLCVPPELLAAHLKHLSQHWRPMSLPQLVDSMAGGSIPEGAIGLTFDGGYIDHLTTVQPLLVQNGLPATFFVTTGHLDQGHEPWWYDLERMLLACSSVPELTLRGTPLRLSTPESPPVPIDRRLQTASPVERDHLLRALRACGKADLAVREDHRTLRASEIVELAASENCSIGAHGIHHLDLRAAHPDLRHREICESRSALARLLGQIVEGFAYPFGAVDHQVLELARSAGYQFAVGNEARALGQDDDPLRLPRLPVGPLDEAAFATWLDEHLGI